jgi:hypothetical protein
MVMNPWRPIKISRLAWFCHHAPAALRWQIEVKPGGHKLQITTPNGLLDLKIFGGVMVRKQEK